MMILFPHKTNLVIGSKSKKMRIRRIFGRIPVLQSTHRHMTGHKHVDFGSDFSIYNNFFIQYSSLMLLWKDKMSTGTS